ncbi:MAG: MATE family efflux transporter [Bacteroidales bacterium]|nr:MATE family efflux transporter [Bacteroidales bacterium]
MTRTIKFSRIWNIACPIIIGNIAQNLLSISDTAFLGHLDAISLGAAALGGVAYLSIMMLGMGFSIGIQIIIARMYGAGRIGQIGSVLHHALFFIIPFAGVLWGVCYRFGNDMLSLLIRSPEVLHEAGLFFDVRIAGILFGFLVYVCQSFFVGVAQTKIISYITCLMVAVNIVFDWLLIFGHAGFPAMGIRGAALASVLSEAVAVAVYVAHVYRKKAFREYGIFRRMSYRQATMTHLVKIAVPVSLQNFLSVGSWFIFFILVEKMGEQELAVSNIGRSLYTLLLLPLWGFASAVNALVSYSIGCGKPQLTLPIMGKITLITVASILVMAAFTALFAKQVINIYTDIPDLGAATIGIMPSICLSAVFFGMGFICFNTVSGTGNTHVSLLIEIFATCIYIAVAMMAVEVWRWGILHVWLVDGIYGVTVMIASLTYLAGGGWMKQATSTSRRTPPEKT